MKQKGITVGTYINKIKKKNTDLPICPTCKKCKDKSICKNRTEMSNCSICKKCKDDGHCDKFYIHVQAKAMLTVGKDIDTKETIRKTFTGNTEEEALDKLYKYKLELKKTGKTFEMRKTEKTIAIIGQEIEDSKFRKGKTKGNAYRTNMATLNRIKKEKFANIPIEKVTKQHIENFLEKERIKSNSVLKKDFSMLKRIFETAIDNMYVTSDFFIGINKIELPKSTKEDKDVKALSLTEQNILVNYLEQNDSKYKNIILMCLYTGMRIGEVLALNYKEDIDLDSKQITVCRTLTKNKDGKTVLGNPKTESGKRIIQINEFTENIIKKSIKICSKNNPNNVLYCQPNGKLIETNTINSHFKRVCKNAGITRAVNIHCLRHSYATRCIEAGVTLPVLQALMGHADVETTINAYGDIYKYLELKEHQKFIDYIKSGRAKIG